MDALHYVQIIQGDASPSPASPAAGNLDREGSESMPSSKQKKYKNCHWIDEMVHICRQILSQVSILAEFLRDSLNIHSSMGEIYMRAPLPCHMD